MEDWRKRGLWRAGDIQGLEIWNQEWLYQSTWEQFATGRTPAEAKALQKNCCIIRWCRAEDS